MATIEQLQARIDKLRADMGPDNYGLAPYRMERPTGMESRVFERKQRVLYETEVKLWQAYCHAGIVPDIDSPYKARRRRKYPTPCPDIKEARESLYKARRLSKRNPLDLSRWLAVQEAEQHLNSLLEKQK